MRRSQILDMDSLRRSLKAEISRSAEARYLHRLHYLSGNHPATRTAQPGASKVLQIMVDLTTLSAEQTD